MDGAIQKALGDKADYYLGFTTPKISKDRLHLPGPDFVDRIVARLGSQQPRSREPAAALQDRAPRGDRLPRRSCRSTRGSSTRAGASFAKNPDYFDPENIVKLAIEGGCNAVASTFGVLGMVARRYAHKIPFLVKINHNELLTYPNKADQILFGTVKEAADMGAAAVGATIYFGSDQSGAADRRGRPGVPRARTSWAWRPCSGATCGTRRSRRTRTTTCPPISPARPTTSA